MLRWWIAVALVTSVMAGPSVAGAQSGRTSSMEGPQPRATPGTRMGPEMRDGVYNPEEAVKHLGDMMRHLGAMLNRLGEAAMYGRLPAGPANPESSRLLNQIAVMTQQIARITGEGRMPRRTMAEMGDQMAAMQEAMKRIPELVQVPPK